jgi:exopolysaccharide biosynthesis polyprenyl glycosylphosphotransferase
MPSTRARGSGRLDGPNLFQRYDPTPSVGPTEPVSRTEQVPSNTAGRRRPYSRRLFVELSRLSDAAVALLVYGSVFVLANAQTVPYGVEEFLLLRLSLGNLLTLGAFASAWQLLFLLFGLYDCSAPRSLRAEAPNVAAAATLGALISLVPTFWSDSGAYSLRVVLLAWPLTIAATLSVRFVLRLLAERVHVRRARRILIVGSGPLAVQHFKRLADDTAAYDVLGFVDTTHELQLASVRERIVASLDQLEPYLMRTVVDEVLIALPIKSRYTQIQRVIEECERVGVQSRYSPDLFPSRLARARLETPDGEWSLNDTAHQPVVAMKVVSDDYRLSIKRMIDVVGALIGLAVLAPLMSVIALAIVTTSSGPAFFAQERYGWRKRRFLMYKFRTMVADAESMLGSLESQNEAVGPIFKMRQDPRVTRLGRFLRRTSLDELPQLWNVMRGEMSLVGPRPMSVRDVSLFSEASLMRRFSVVPGISGLWQISGRSDLPFHRWMELDLRYIDNWSLLFDLKILACTIVAVLSGRGAK